MSTVIIKKNYLYFVVQKEGAKEEEPNEPGKRALLSLKSKACQKIYQKVLFTGILCTVPEAYLTHRC